MPLFFLLLRPSASGAGDRIGTQYIKLLGKHSRMGVFIPENTVHSLYSILQ
jgi:hypothetical protein